MTTCSTPISWLRLERHHLGELDAVERDAVTQHLRACAFCQALAQEIATDDASLPALVPVIGPRRPWYASRARTMAIASGVALAAGVMLTIAGAVRAPAPSGGDQPIARSKGSDVSLTLVREDEGVVTEAGGAYRSGERFKALVTCAPATNASFDLAVFERGDVSFPLPAPAEFACGNAVPIAGAFRVTGRERMRVCLVWQAEGAIDREMIRRTPPDLLNNARCTTLEPAP